MKISILVSVAPPQNVSLGALVADIEQRGYTPPAETDETRIAGPMHSTPKPKRTKAENYKCSTQKYSRRHLPYSKK